MVISAEEEDISSFINQYFICTFIIHSILRIIVTILYLFFAFGGSFTVTFLWWTFTFPS